MIRTYKNGSIRLTGNDAQKMVSALRGDDKVELFNLNYKVGDEVRVTDDDGNEFIDIVKYPASIMGGHTAMMWLEGKGSYLLSRLIAKVNSGGV